jgi:hypothetical protein
LGYGTPIRRRTEYRCHHTIIGKCHNVRRYDICSDNHLKISHRDDEFSCGDEHGINDSGHDYGQYHIVDDTDHLYKHGEHLGDHDSEQ